MKNKIQKIVMAMLITILMGTNNSYAGGTYAGRGALIGAGTGGVILGGLVLASGLNCSEYDETCSALPVLYGFGYGALIGGLIGVTVGAFIPKNPKVSVAPIFTQSKTNGTTAGGSLQMRF